ncbi:MAG: aminomethyl-transferring glycine dehydrogenase subunit GcvPA [Clostridiaceae bacterium]|nr:aminomethyl-transferring glycine dehydrogenase subunit GcvPA [Clostridiaceae bacterium]
MSYIPQTDSDRRAMLDTVGAPDIRALYASVPDEVYLTTPLNLPEGCSEQQVGCRMRTLARANVRYESIFRGAGTYHHYIPEIVRRVVTKEEFVTAYTPYQPEVSQGLLQSIFEYQTMICRLTGMDTSNASVYDGATAAAEAAAMCRERNRAGVLISETVHPQVREVVATYCRAATGEEPILIPSKDGVTDTRTLEALLSAGSACVITQQPNYYGCFEDAGKIAALTHAAGAKYILSSNPISLAACKSPAEYGADIAVGDGQPLGIPLSYGGPTFGFMACRAALTRRLPGRIVGETVDAKGRRCFVLTLQAREQHIRREKAQSNICSNEALCAMTAAVYMAAMGAEGLRRAAALSMRGAKRLADALTTLPGVTLPYAAPFFDEFITLLPCDADRVLRVLEAEHILGGLPLIIDGKPALLWCVTEENTDAEIDRVAELVGKAVHA